MKLGNVEKILLRLGEIYLLYKDNKTEMIYIKNENAETGTIDERISILKYCKNARDLYNEQQNNGIVGTTLVNFLNIADTIKETLNNYLDTINKYDVKNIDNNNLPVQYDLLNVIINWQNDLTNKINSFPLSVMMYIIFTNFKNDYLNKDLYHLMENCKSKMDRSNYYKEMTDYLESILDKTVAKSKWFSKFSEKEMITVFIKSLISDIDFVVANCEKDIEKYPTIAKSKKCKIETLLDLFYASKYHIQFSSKKLKRCKNCKKYFITKFKRNEEYCRRRVKKYKYTCSELASKNYRGKSEYANNRKELSRVENKIYSMLRLRDTRNGTNELKTFKIKQEKVYLQIEQIASTEDEETTEKIQWINDEHSRLKNNKN